MSKAAERKMVQKAGVAQNIYHYSITIKYHDDVLEIYKYVHVGFNCQNTWLILNNQMVNVVTTSGRGLTGSC